MRSLALTDDEVRLVTALRTLPAGQRDIALEVILEMAAPEISDADANGGSVIPFPRD